MDVLVVLAVYSRKTGKLLIEVRCVVECDDCKDFEVCKTLYGNDIREFCENVLFNTYTRDFTGADYEKNFTLTDLSALDKQLSCISDNDPDYNDFVRERFGGLD